MFITAIESKVAPKVIKAAEKVEKEVAKVAEKSEKVEDLGNYYLRYDARNALIKSPKIDIAPAKYFSPSTPVLGL